MSFPIESSITIITCLILSNLAICWWSTWKGPGRKGSGKSLGPWSDPPTSPWCERKTRSRAETCWNIFLRNIFWKAVVLLLVETIKQSRSSMYLCLGCLSFNRCGPFDITLEVFIAFCPLSSVVYLWFSCEVTYCTCVNTCSHMEVHVERYGVKHSFQTSIKFALNIVLLFFFNGGLTFTMDICSCIKNICVHIILL